MGVDDKTMGESVNGVERIVNHMGSSEHGEADEQMMVCFYWLSPKTWNIDADLPNFKTHPKDKS